jgi:hypothetical protein
LKLVFGFKPTPYGGQVLAVGRKPGTHSTYGQGKTSSQVAKELEATYGIVDTFYQMTEDDIIEVIEEGFLEEIEGYALAGRMHRKGISDRFTRQVEQKFRQSLKDRRFDGVINGVPTSASLRGVSHLKIHAFAKRGSRPSFIDTGTYMKSFRAWVEDID